MRIGIIGGGVIARLVLEHIRNGELGDVQVVAIAGRSAQSRGKPLADAFGIPFVVGLDALAATKPEAVVEAASHDAVREYGEALLARGMSAFDAAGAGAWLHAEAGRRAGNGLIAEDIIDQLAAVAADCR